MKKAFAALLLALLLLGVTFSFSSCKDDAGEVVFSYGDAVMTERLYIYELSMMKSQFLSEMGYDGQDLPAVWSESIGEGLTFGDYFYANCQLNICKTLYFADIAIQNGGLNAMDEAEIDSAMADIVSQMGSKAIVSAYLENYGINYDLYRDYLELYALSSKGTEIAYGVGGEREISENRMKEYYHQNYITVKHVSVGTDVAGADEQGNYIYYTDEEKAERAQRIVDIRADIAAGADFDELYKTSEDKQYATYPDGMTITKGALGTDMADYEEACLALEVGEVGEYVKEGLAHYFIKRVELLESDFDNCRTFILTALLEQDQFAAVLENYPNFTMDQDIIDSYGMGSIAVMQ
jgi:hypothetical protein